MRVHHVRVPLDHLLARTGKVSVDGQYHPPHKSLVRTAYRTMVHIRALLVVQSSIQLARYVFWE